MKRKRKQSGSQRSMNTTIHWYHPGELIYWNAHSLRTTGDLEIANATLLSLLDESGTGDVHILMDWQGVFEGDILMDQVYLKHYLTFAEHPNMGALVAFHAGARHLTANMVLYAYATDLNFRLVGDLGEALAHVGLTIPVIDVPRLNERAAFSG